MVKSMTGFGRGEAKFGNGKITVEIKTVNHKFFDETLKLPSGIATFEDRIKEAIQKRMRRGKINLSLVYDGKLPKNERITIDKKVAKNYRDELSRLSRHLGLSGEVAMKDIIALPGVLSYDAMEGDLSAIWPKIK